MAGDGLALLADPPATVVLIDGIFDEAPAIRHKELLVLVAVGVRVIGAASMGALRAAELHRFGMVGVGRIFDAYAAGRLVGDDEVAVLHGPEELDFAPMSEPLINVRATLVAAVRARQLSPPEARNMRRLAQAVFYKDRTWRRLLDQGRDSGLLAADQAESFGDWLTRSAVDLKRADALACIEAALSPSGPPYAGSPPPDTLFTQALADQVARGVRHR
jgi:hypothetical protein